MAKCECILPDVFAEKLSELAEKTDAICEKALKAGGEVVLAKVKSNLNAVINNNLKSNSRSTGELVSALGLSSVRTDRNGILNIKIGFSEPRSDGGSNARIANILEYGKSGQSPKPFLKSAKSASKGACTQAMLRVFEEEMK